VSAGKAGGAARIVLGLLYPRRLQKTYHAAGGGCRNRACQVRSWSSEEAGGLDLENRWKIGPFAHTCASVVGVSVEPPVVGRDWSPVSSNKARGCCCRTPGGHRAPLQPRRTAFLVFTCTWSSADQPRRSGVGLAPRPPQVLPMPQRAWFYICLLSKTHVGQQSFN
jgi:hypothetical protein